MRALIIDPHRHEVREADADFLDFWVMRQWLADGRPSERFAPICAGPRLSQEVHTYVDDEGYFRPAQAWFSIIGYPNPLAGYMVLLGDDPARPGDVAPLPAYVTAPRMWGMVEWITPEAGRAMAPPVNVYSGPNLETVTLQSSTPVDFADLRPLLSPRQRQFLREIRDTLDRVGARYFYQPGVEPLADELLAMGCFESHPNGQEIVISPLGQKALS